MARDGEERGGGREGERERARGREREREGERERERERAQKHKHAQLCENREDRADMHGCNEGGVT